MTLHETENYIEGKRYNVNYNEIGKVISWSVTDKDGKRIVATEQDKLVIFDMMNKNK